MKAAELLRRTRERGRKTQSVRRAQGGATKELQGSYEYNEKSGAATKDTQTWTKDEYY